MCFLVVRLTRFRFLPYDLNAAGDTVSVCFLQTAGATQTVAVLLKPLLLLL